jgi:Tfp pilus assembly protein PilF
VGRKNSSVGKAHLQLAILLAARKETSAAIEAFKKAIENLAFSDEAHDRLAQIYRQSAAGSRPPCFGQTFITDLEHLKIFQCDSLI